MIKITIENTDTKMSIERKYEEGVTDLNEQVEEMIELVSPEDKPVPF